MKYLLLTTVLIFSSFSFAQEAQSVTCQKVAVQVAINAMNKSLAAEKRQNHSEDPTISKRLQKEERAIFEQVVNLDQNEEETNVDTGVYGVEMTVMEECLDGLKVETRMVNKNGQPQCQIIKVSSYGDRDCG